jgi:hypothetical protein
MLPTQWIALGLGLFEFAVGPSNFFQYTQKNPLIPLGLIGQAGNFMYRGERSFQMTYLMFQLMLGLQRLTYAFSDHDNNKKKTEKYFTPFMCLILTHILESVYWYALAFETWGSKYNNNLLMMITDAASFQFAKDYPFGNETDAFLLLIVVPLITILLFVIGTFCE